MLGDRVFPLVDLIYETAGQSRARLRTLPPLLLRAVAVANPTVREMLEMQYEFEEPFVVDSRKITETLGVRATPIEQALDETLATYRSG